MHLIVDYRLHFAFSRGPYADIHDFAGCHRIRIPFLGKVAILGPAWEKRELTCPGEKLFRLVMPGGRVTDVATVSR